MEYLNCSMRTKLLFFLFLTGFACISMDAQNSYTGFVATPPEFHKHVALTSAFSYSVINNRKEVRGQYKPGINVGLQYVTHPWFAWSAEYTSFFKHNSSPGFVDIHSWNTELNGIFSFGMATSDLKFRFVFGMSYLNWAGTFVGPSANDDKTWYYGKRIEQDWVGANLGFGFAHPIGKSFTGNIDFRSRFASEKKDLVSISDTAFLLGIKWEPYILMNDKSKKANSENKTHKKSGSARPSRMYKWLKKRTS
jgi:hypothetical protein